MIYSPVDKIAPKPGPTPTNQQNINWGKTIDPVVSGERADDNIRAERAGRVEGSACIIYADDL